MEVPEQLKKELAALTENFYGTVEIAIQDGLPVTIRTTKTVKIYGERSTRHGHSLR